jgi:molybdopterin-synthase adenylyltransferase
MTPIVPVDIDSEILTNAESISDSAGREVKIIREARAIELAKKHHVHLRSIYKNAFELGICPYRYIRNRDSITPADQLKLIQSRVAVIGAGGLGGYIILLLARIGIGSLKIADPEKFDETNLNRQALALANTINMHKVETARQMVESINPAVELTAYPVAINKDNAGEILKGVAVIADALDNIPDRLLLQEQAAKLKIPLVHAAVAGFEGQIATIYPDDFTLNPIYGKPGAKDLKSDSAESVLGVPALTPAFIGSLQVMEILKILLNRGNTFRKQMLYADLETGDFHQLSLEEK